MKHRERVIKAFNHEETDRPPFQATFTPEFADRLREAFKLPAMFTEPHHRQWYGYDLELLTGQDALQAGVGWFTNYYLKPEPYTDEWGVKWKIDAYETKYGVGHYTNIAENPLRNDDEAALKYKAPDPDRPELYTHVERLVKEYGDEYYIIGRVHCTMFESAWALRGLDVLMTDFYINPDLVNHLLDETCNYHKKVALCEQAEAVADSTDWKKTTEYLISLQKQWKEIGPVSRKKSEQVWTRFRAACDKFFDNKSRNFGGADPEQVQNYRDKMAVIEEISAYQPQGEREDEEAARAFVKRWNAIGHVPFSEKDAIQEKFRDVLSAKFQGYSGYLHDRQAPARADRRRDTPARMERDRLVQKFRKLETEIATYENNLGFFANSRNAEKLISDINRKIETLRNELGELEMKIKELDSAE